jgi:hypothetical protein
MKNIERTSRRYTRAHRMALHQRNLERMRTRPRVQEHDGVDTVISFLGIVVFGLFLFGVLNVLF